MRTAAELGHGYSPTEIWLGLVAAELAWGQGDYADAARICAATLAKVEAKPAVWWYSFRGLVGARLAMAAFATGDPERCRSLLGAALADARQGLERLSMAAVVDGIAVFALEVAPRPGMAGGSRATAATSTWRPPDPPRDRAELAARLLGAGHAIRGRFDEGSLDAPAVRDAARRVLGEPGFDAAYEQGHALTLDDAAAFAARVVEDHPVAPPL